jgi:hypothetical protein
VGVEQEKVELFLMWLDNELPKYNLSDYQFEGEGKPIYLTWCSAKFDTVNY